MANEKKSIQLPNKEELIAGKLAEGYSEEFAKDYADGYVKGYIQGHAKETARFTGDILTGVFEHEIPASIASELIRDADADIIQMLQLWEDMDISKKEKN